MIGLPIPGGLSFLVHRNTKTPVTGLDQIPQDEWPNVQLVFQFYHLMVMLWGLMVILAVISWFAYKKRRWAVRPFFLSILSFSVLCPEVCNEVGWFAAEMGRQPWVVYGLLKTKDAVSPIIRGEQVIQSLILFSLVFVCLLSLFLFLLCKKYNEDQIKTILMRWKYNHGIFISFDVAHSLVCYTGGCGICLFFRRWF